MATNTDEIRQHTEACLSYTVDAQTDLQNVLDTLAGEKDSDMEKEFEDAYAALRNALDSLAEAQDRLVDPVPDNGEP
jgi:hypothetical protein